MGSIKKFEGHLDAANKNNLALEKQLDSASKEICYLQRQNEKLEQGMRDLTDDFAKEADDCLQAQQEVVVLKNECATLEGRINDLDSRVEEQNKEITRILDQNSKLQKFQDQQKNVQLINHGEDLTISEKNKTIVALTQQLRDARENEESVRKILVMDKDRNTNLKKDVKEWKQRNQGLVDENNAFRRQIIEFKAQLRRAKSSNTHIAPRQGVSAGSIPNNSISRSSGSEALPQQGFSMGSVQSGSTARSPIAEVSREQAMANLRAFSNNPNTPPRQSSHSSSMGNRNLSEASPSSAIRQSSTTSPSSVRRASFTATSSRSRVRDAPTATQADFIRRVRRLRDDQLQNLAEAFDEVRTIQPGEGVHWVKGVSIPSIFNVPS
jgi:cell division protein FtsB